MARDFYINGETLVLVKGRVDFSNVGGVNFGNLQQLGLAADPIRITPNFRHRDINVDAWGEAPADVQFMLADLTVTMNLIHFDLTVLNICVNLSAGGFKPVNNLPAAGSPGIPLAGINYGQMARAGTRLGGNNAISTNAGVPAGNNYVRLNLASPGAQLPWTFPSSYLTGPPEIFPLGNEKSVVQLQWRVIPYTTDPAGLGPPGTTIYGAQGYQLFYLGNLDT